jgi:S1-C subfamily serine protease
MKTHKQLIWFLIFSTTMLVASLPGLAQHDWVAQINEFKPMVVNIEKSSEIVFEVEKIGTAHATGFVVDAKRGIIATNAHVTGISPSFVKINFFDGSFTEARILYYDPVHDFGFYKIDPATVKFKLIAVKMGFGKKLKVGDELLMIGNNEKEEYSIKFGATANLNVNKGLRHSSYIHTTFDRTGGSSGSPVWNTRGEVVGIHASGTDTSSFELPIEYVLDALKKIQKNIPIKRGDIGVDLDLISVGEAIQHFNVPETVRDEIKSFNNRVPKMIQVQSIIPRSSGEQLLRAGDILYRLNQRLLGDDLYLFDKTLNENVGRSVAIDLFRCGKTLRIDVAVEDLEHKKIRRFVHFGGAVFHEITPRMRWYNDFNGDGIYLSYATEGSSFSRLGMRNEKTRTLSVIITEINGHAIRSLDDFLTICTAIRDGSHTYVLRRDLSLYQLSLNPKNVTLNLKYGPLEVFTWNENSLEWEQERLSSASL